MTGGWAPWELPPGWWPMNIPSLLKKGDQPMDTKVILKNNKIITDLYQKPTDSETI